MGFYATETPCLPRPEAGCDRPQETYLPPKNRVGGFSASSPTRARRSTPQTLEPHRENEPTPTTTASGVRFYGYRYYSSTLGRWVSRDPVGDESFLWLQLSNLDWKEWRKREKQLRGAALKPSYLYVNNHPISEVDPLGLDTAGGGVTNGPIDPTFGCWIDPPERICGTGKSLKERCCRLSIEAVLAIDPGAVCQGSATACEACCVNRAVDDPMWDPRKTNLCVDACELKRVACTGGL